MIKIFPKTNSKTEMKEILKLLRNFLVGKMSRIGLMVSICIIIGVIIFLISKYLRESLIYTHKNLSKTKTEQKNLLDSELEQICDFESNSK